jgi:hypothetical protein
MGRRSNQGAPISFFSFQDIITTVTGILILVTLLLSLDLSTSAVSESSPTDNPTPIDDDRLRAAHSELLATKARAQILSEVVDAAGSSPQGVVAAEQTELVQSAWILEQQVVAAAQSRRQAANARQDAVVTHQQSTALKEKLEAQLSQTHAELAELAKRGNVRLLAGVQTKAAVVIECRADGIRVGRISDSGELKLTQQIARSDLGAGLRRVSDSLRPSAEYFVVYIQPDAIKCGGDVLDQLRGTGFDVGWDLLGSARRLFEN